MVEMPGLLRLHETRGGIYAVTVLDVSQSGLRVSCPRLIMSGVRVEVTCRDVTIVGIVRYARDVGDEIHLGIEADLAETAANNSMPTELDLTSLFPKDQPRLRRP